MWYVAFLVLVLVATDTIPPFFGGVAIAVIVQWLRSAGVASPPNKKRVATAVVSVVGNIGSGKSTALRLYAKDAPGDVAIVQEPVDEWAPLLDQMTSNQDAWIDLQVVAASFYATLVAPAIADVLMQERDLMSVALFAGNRKGIATLLLALVECGNIILPDVVVHIATAWESCLARIQERNQAGDQFAGNLGAEYLCALNDRHQRLLEWYAAQGCFIITLRNDDTAVIGLSEAREQALAARKEGPRRKVTKAMMASLLHLLWSPLPEPAAKPATTGINEID